MYPYFLGDIEMSMGNVGEASAIYSQANDILSARAKRLAAQRAEPTRRILISASPTHRHIGELARMLDLFVKARSLGLINGFEPLLLAPAAETANLCLLDYWRDHVTVVAEETDSDAMYDIYAGREFRMDYITLPTTVGPIREGDRAAFDKDMSYALVCRQWEKKARPPVLSLKPEHREKGRRRLVEAGMPEEAWFVCLHVRDQEYYGEDSPFSINRHRSSDIMRYIPAIEAITRRGGWVIRVGAPQAPALPQMENVIDYALSDLRSDWLDIFCFAAARFFLGSASGPQCTAAVFGVPVVSSDLFPLGNWPPSAKDIFIHRLLARKHDGRVLSIAQSLRPPLFNANCPALIERMGLEVVGNTEEEILEATEEMLDRFDGTLTYSPDDDRLQEIYKRGADPYEVGISPRLGRRFLQRHPELLGEEPLE